MCCGVWGVLWGVGCVVCWGVCCVCGKISLAFTLNCIDYRSCPIIGCPIIDADFHPPKIFFENLQFLHSYIVSLNMILSAPSNTAHLEPHQLQKMSSLILLILGMHNVTQRLDQEKGQHITSSFIIRSQLMYKWNGQLETTLIDKTFK